MFLFNACITHKYIIIYTVHAYRCIEPPYVIVAVLGIICLLVRWRGGDPRRIFVILFPPPPLQICACRRICLLSLCMVDNLYDTASISSDRPPCLDLVHNLPFQGFPFHRGESCSRYNILADLLCLFGFLTVQNLLDSVDIKSFVDTYSYLYGDYQFWIRNKYIIHFVFIWHSHSVNRAFTVHFALAFSLCVRSSLNKFRSASTHRLLRVRSPFAQRALTIQ